ncbi:hypothetical protein M2394_003203 [Pseudomonas sp. BIGb0164]|nr:hypothetical protein [Pseudomonas sp. BIGb0164]
MTIACPRTAHGLTVDVLIASFLVLTEGVEQRGESRASCQKFCPKAGLSAEGDQWRHYAIAVGASRKIQTRCCRTTQAEVATA